MPSGVPRIPEAREWLLLKVCTRCGDKKPWAKFPPRTYFPDGSVRRVASHCSTCDSKMTLARQKQMRQDRGASFERYEAARRVWQRRKRAAIRAERTSGGARIPSGPIADLIRRVVEEEGDFMLVAEQCGSTERVFRRLMGQENVTLRLADQICTRLGVRIYDLYPELEEAAA